MAYEIVFHFDINYPIKSGSKVTNAAFDLIHLKNECLFFNKLFKVVFEPLSFNVMNLVLGQQWV